MNGENYNLTCRENKSRFNQEQYDILKRCSQQKNINEWNNYLAGQPGIRIHLQNADLRKAALEGVKLSGADLEGARLEGANLFAADLKKANLKRANLDKANLWGATLCETDLEGASFASANLENADLRGANLDKANLWGANLEGAIVETAADDSMPSSKEKTEVLINLVNDITYKELLSLLKCLERLSSVIGDSLPNLNEIQITRHIEGNAAWAAAAMENNISVSIPKNVAENLNGIFLLGIADRQTMDKAGDDGTGTGKKNSESRENLRELLANAAFSESERKTIFSNQTEEDRLIEEIHPVANLVESGRINVQVASNSSLNIIS